LSISLAIVFIIICLLLEGFFASSELSFISLNKFLLKNKADNKDTRAVKVLNLLKNPAKLIVVTLLGTNLATVTMTAIATLTIIKYFGEDKIFLTSLIISPLTIVFGEFIPKKIGEQYADKLALLVVYPIKFIKFLFYPIVYVLVKYTDLLAYVLKLKNTQKNFVADKFELKLILDELNNSNKQDAEEIKMVDNVLDFGDIYAQDCMLALVMVDALSTDNTLKDAIKLISEKGHSRIPIYIDRIDNIQGLVFSFDIFKEENLDSKLKNIMKPCLYVSLTHRADDLLILFKQSGTHMAIVVDEFGGAVGIITLDDILEEVVGEINDEFDEEEHNVKLLANNLYLVDASIEVEVLKDDYSIEIQEGDYISLAGYLLDLFERIPLKGEKIEDNNNIYFISNATNRKIEEVIIRVKV